MKNWIVSLLNWLLSRLVGNSPSIDISYHCPNSSTVIHCDECGTMSMAWHEGYNGKSKWSTDCIYDCCCLDCFTSDLEGDIADMAVGDGPSVNRNADLFPSRVELDARGWVTVYRPDTKPWMINLNLSH